MSAYNADISMQPTNIREMLSLREHTSASMRDFSHRIAGTGGPEGSETVESRNFSQSILRATPKSSTESHENTEHFFARGFGHRKSCTPTESIYITGSYYAPEPTHRIVCVCFTCEQNGTDLGGKKCSRKKFLENKIAHTENIVETLMNR